MKKEFLFLTITALLLSACNSTQKAKTYSADQIKAESKKANDFMDRKYDEAIDRNPEAAANLGLKTHYSDWSERTDSFYQKELAISKANLDSLKMNFDSNALDIQTKLSVRMYEEQVKLAEENNKWRFHGYWISQMGGEHTDIPSFLINIHKIDSLADAQSYISRLSKLGKVFDQVIDQLKVREAKGIIPPHFTFPYVTNDINSFIKGLNAEDASNVLLTDFTTKVGKLSIEKTRKEDLIKEAKTQLTTVVKPAYERLLDYWTRLETKAVGDSGVWALPEGIAFYNNQLKNHTTTDLTADQIFETGQKEVARIHQEMHAIMKQVNYKNDSLQEFIEYMRTNPKFQYSNDQKGRDELLAESNKYISEMKAKLPELFLTLPKAPVVVMPVEKFREKSVAGAFYENPSLDGSRPGRFYVNLSNMKSEARYEMEALCHHEAIPGHHMQIAIAQELTNIPKFRRQGGNTAYIEGWALYSEKIPKEIGFYQDPYSDFGRLSMEIFRAARLVVDAGIHSKKWTKQQAIDYMVQNTANTKGDVAREIERYFIWPGQATGYKIGMLKILELREQAKKDLGAKFDIRGFHDVILTNGAVPLNILEELVNQWVETKKKG